MSYLERFSIVLYVSCLFVCVISRGVPENTLYEDDSRTNIFLINSFNGDHLERRKRDATTTPLPEKNVLRKTDTVNCQAGHSACGNGLCIPNTWLCDGDYDCLGREDESAEQCRNSTCPAHLFRCTSGRCIYKSWVCDGENDCQDHEDEKDCHLKGIDVGHPGVRQPSSTELPIANESERTLQNCGVNQSDCANPKCAKDEFECADGHCIKMAFVCDGADHCKDGSDERNCTVETVKCPAGAVPCGNHSNAMCLPDAWICDGEKDCPQGEDEDQEECRTKTCPSYKFRCPSGKCIFKAWICDGENDCKDIEASDEKNCSQSHSGEPSKIICADGTFQCGKACAPIFWRCDGINDCDNNSDEMGCQPERIRPQSCGANLYTCSPGVCIPLQWLCDGAKDCSNGSDEAFCVQSRKTLNALLNLFLWGLPVH